MKPQTQIGDDGHQPKTMGSFPSGGSYRRCNNLCEHVPSFLFVVLIFTVSFCINRFNDECVERFSIIRSSRASSMSELKSPSSLSS